MGKERSFVRKRKRGCLSGCLTRLILLLGLAAVLLVGACVLGFVKIDQETGAPMLSLESVGLGGVSLGGFSLESVSLPRVSLPQLALPGWAYSLNSAGLTVKTLRAGDGEAVLVCSDGYTMLLGAGPGLGLMTSAQLLLCGVNHLNVAVAMSAENGQIAGMSTVLSLMKPDYLIYQNSQTKNEAYNRMLQKAQGIDGLMGLVPQQGQTFSLGRATVTFVGPTRTNHIDERDDGLSVRIDYGETSLLVMGTVTAAGEMEMATSRANLDVDAIICARGGSDAATGAEIVQAASPSIALLTGKAPANSVRVRLERAGAQIYAASDHGVMTLVSDGQTIRVEP